MFGRETLREFVRGENQNLRELIRNQHEEYMRDQDRREEEFRVDRQRRDEEFREFMREMVVRHEKVFNPILAEMEEGRKQIRANTEAVLRQLDRFDQPGGAAT